jgi:hypothetical protein
MYGATSSGASDRGGFGFYTYSGGGTGSDSLTLYYNANFANNLTTTQVFRDPSAWYHIIYAVDTTQATASNRVKLYVNGVQVTAFSASNYPTQNYQFAIGNNVAQWISSEAGTQRYFDGYLAEVNFIDGTQLTPSSFGTTDAYGIWQPIPYTGSYGTNGFYLPFTDNSALTTSSNVGLGKDFSGNGNYWTTNNISITAGSTYDSMTDVPTNTSATTANYCVLNPVNATSATGTSLSNANLQINGIGSGNVNAWIGTLGVSSGKWYYEVTMGENNGVVGISQTGNPNQYPGGDATSYGYSSSTKYNNNTSASYGASLTAGDVVGCAYDLDAGTITFYKNNVSQGVAYSGLSGNYFPAVRAGTTGAAVSINFGQRPFSYTPPSGFYPLNTYNLPTPTILDGDLYFNATLYTGNGTGQSITNAGSMQPDFVWVKSRTQATSNYVYDSLRGAGYRLATNLTVTEALISGVTSFDSNGFTVGTETGNNNTGDSYVGWQWRASNAAGVSNTQGTITSTVSANTTAGFSIATFTTPGGYSTGTVGHGLGVTPSMIIVKNRTAPSGANNWNTFHTSIGNTGALYLNTTGATTTSSAFWNNTSPTSSVFTIGSNLYASTDYVAYCFSQVAGYSAFGSYTGNGSSDGPFVFTGFRPRFVIVKNTVDPNNWVTFDSERNTYNIVNLQLYPNTSDAEVTGSSTNGIDFLSNGFKIRSSFNWGNRNGDTIIYMAFAENPFKIARAR